MEQRLSFGKAGRQHPEYYAPVDPYEEQPPCKYDLRELTGYARKVGKRITELTYDEIERRSVCDEVST